MLRRAKFVIGGLNGVFEGYTEGDHWNGFACPMFDKENVSKIVHEYDRADNKNSVLCDPFEDTYTFMDENDDIDDDPLVYKGTDVEYEGKSIRVYAIGSHYWTWREHFDVPDILCRSCSDGIVDIDTDSFETNLINNGDGLYLRTTVNGYCNICDAHHRLLVMEKPIIDIIVEVK